MAATFAPVVCFATLAPSACLPLLPREPSPPVALTCLANPPCCTSTQLLSSAPSVLRCSTSFQICCLLVITHSCMLPLHCTPQLSSALRLFVPTAAAGPCPAPRPMRLCISLLVCIAGSRLLPCNPLAKLSRAPPGGAGAWEAASWAHNNQPSRSLLTRAPAP